MGDRYGSRRRDDNNGNDRQKTRHQRHSNSQRKNSKPKPSDTTNNDHRKYSNENRNGNASRYNDSDPYENGVYDNHDDSNENGGFGFTGLMSWMDPSEWIGGDNNDNNHNGGYDDDRGYSDDDNNIGNDNDVYGGNYNYSNRHHHLSKTDNDLTRSGSYSKKVKVHRRRSNSKRRVQKKERRRRSSSGNGNASKYGSKFNNNNYGNDDDDYEYYYAEDNGGSDGFGMFVMLGLEESSKSKRRRRRGDDNHNKGGVNGFNGNADADTAHSTWLDGWGSIFSGGEADEDDDTDTKLRKLIGSEDGYVADYDTESNLLKPRESEGCSKSERRGGRISKRSSGRGSNYCGDSGDDGENSIVERGSVKSQAPSVVGMDRHGSSSSEAEKSVGTACMYWMTGPLTCFVGHRYYIKERWPVWYRGFTCNILGVGWFLDLCALRELTISWNMRERFGHSMAKPRINRVKTIHPPKVKQLKDGEMLRYEMRSQSFRAPQRQRRKSIAPDALEETKKKDARKQKRREAMREQNKINKKKFENFRI